MAAEAGRAAQRIARWKGACQSGEGFTAAACNNKLIGARYFDEGFLQRLEAGALDGTEVHEEVRAAFRGDEAEALGIVEPLHGALLTIRHVLTPETIVEIIAAAAYRSRD